VYLCSQRPLRGRTISRLGLPPSPPLVSIITARSETCRSTLHSYRSAHEVVARSSKAQTRREPRRREQRWSSPHESAANQTW